MATMRSLGFSIFTRYDGDGITRARRDLNEFDTGINRSTSSLNSWNGRILLATKAAAVFGPALLPIAASMTKVAGSATVMAATTGTALAAYGLAVKNAITSTNEMAKAGKVLSAAQKDYLASQEKFNKAYADFGKSFRDESLKAVSATLSGMTNILRGMEPVAKALAPEVTKVAQAFEKWTQGDSFKNYVNLIKASAVPAFRSLVAAGKDFLNVVGDGFRAFLPHSTALAKSIQEGAAALKQWSDGGGFQRFLQYARENGGPVREFFTALWNALRNIGAVMKELGPLSLGITTTILQLVAALPAEWIANIVRGFIAWKLAMMGLFVIKTLIGIINGVRAAWFLLNIAFVSTPIGAIILGITALIAVIVLIATKTTWFQTAWKYTWNAIKVAAEAVWNFLTTGLTQLALLILGPIGALLLLLNNWTTVWNAIKLAAEYVWNALKAAWNAVVNAFVTTWTAVSAALSAAWSAVWNAIKAAASAVWTALTAAWNAFINGLQAIWSTVSSALSAAWSATWTAIQAVAQAIWSALTAAWNAFINGLQAIWSAVSAALSATWNAVWTAMQAIAQAIWTALQAAWSAFLTAVQTTWTAVSAALSAAWNAFWTAIQLFVQTIWTALQVAWQAFLTAIQTAWSTVSAALQAAWSAVWTAIQTAAQAVWDALKAAWETFLNGLKELWDTVSAALVDAWQTTWDSVVDIATKVWDEVTQAVEDGINALLTPINGLIDGFNAITDAVGLDISIPNISVNFAAGGMVGDVPHFAAGGTVNFSRGGGVLSGYAPGRDTVPAMLSRGEGVLVPEAVRGLGGSNFVHWANSHYSNGRGGRRVSFPGYGQQRSEAMGFAKGGVALSGGIDAFHRVGGDTGWGFQGGGIVPGPGIGGTPGSGGLPGLGGGLPTVGTDGVEGVGQEAADDDDDGGILGSITDTFKDLVNPFNDGGPASMVLGFIGRAALEKLLNPMIDAITSNFGPVGEIMAGAAKKIAKELLEFLIEKDEAAKKEFESKAVAGAQSVSAWAPLAAQALAMAGLSPGQLPAFLALMAAESGGNPNAINNWDSNAAAGMPSQGLMQVIPPTFAANHVAGTSNNILDPLANMAAAARYILNRYGGIVPGSPYAEGTSNATPGMHLVGEQGPELVVGPGMAMFGGGEQVFNAADTASMMAGGAGATAAPTASMGAAPMGAAPASMAAAGGEASLGGVTDSAEVQALIQALIDSSKVLQQTLAAMWANVVATTNTSWQSMNSQSFSPLIAKMTTGIPAGMALMQAAMGTGMAAVTSGAQVSWTAMDTTAFAPMNTMLNSTVPLAATTMSTGVVTSATAMSTGVVASAGAMSLGAVTSATEMGTGVTTSTQTMQGSVQESWGQMETGTETSWTAIETSITDSVTQATTPINGLLTGFNNVSSSLGMGVSVPLIAFAEGGVLPGFAKGGLARKGGTLSGYAPGKDRIPAILSPGEGVLTPEAVRGLGGPGFVYAANKRWSGHRGAGKGAPSWGQYKDAAAAGGHHQCFATGGIAMSQQKRLLPGGIIDPHTGRQQFMSGTITPQDAAGLAEAGIPHGMISQGSFSTGVAASAGTHDGDGVVDVSSTSVESQMRNVGWAAWTRGNGDGMSPHTHGVYMRATGISPAAMGQVIDYINGGSGLGVGSASAEELAGWGLGLGEWNFGPLIKDLVNLTKTNVPEVLRKLVLQKITAEQVTSGFAEKKAALDAMNVGTGPWADGLKGMGSKSHQGVVDFVSSRAGASSFDSGGWWMPGTYAYNGTSKPELAIPSDDLEDIANGIKTGGGGSGECIHIEFNFNGPVTSPEDVRRAADEAIPRLRSALIAGSGKRIGG